MMEENTTIELAKKTIEESVKAAKEFAGKLINPGLEEAGGIIQDTVKFWRFKNQVNIILKAKKFLEKKGVEPNKVPTQILVPLLENGSLEEDESIQDRWAALLANAADPDKSKSVIPSFPEILKELSPVEVKILDQLFSETSQRTGDKKFEIVFEKDKILNILKITSNEFDIIADNLVRLNLCQPPASYDGVKIGEFPVLLRTYKFICLTPLGYQFVKSCKYE